jgi:uncharacterized protein
VPSSADAMCKSYRYFRSIGYQNIAFVPGAPNEWNSDTIATFECEFRRLGDLVMEDLRRGQPVVVKGLEEYARSRLRDRRDAQTCGAGRGMVLVDIHGDIWPCHRWNKADEAAWQIGSIYSDFNDVIRSPLDTPSFVARLENECPTCPANKMCSGGCPAENLEETGSVYRRHRNACELTRVWARVGQYVHDTMTREQNQAYLAVYCRPDDDDSAPE